MSKKQSKEAEYFKIENLCKKGLALYLVREAAAPSVRALFMPHVNHRHNILSL